MQVLLDHWHDFGVDRYHHDTNYRRRDSGYAHHECSWHSAAASHGGAAAAAPIGAFLGTFIVTSAR
eukprot:3437699-Rhodomonas_salina.3